MKLKIKHLNRVKYLSIYLIAFLTFLFPIYLYNTNRHNLSFCIVQIPLAIFVIRGFMEIKKKKNKLLLFFIIVYFILFSYYNLFYLQCYWALFYKTFSFLLLWQFSQYEEESITNSEFIDSICSVIVFLFTCSVILSIIGNVVGVDAVFFDLRGIHLRSKNSNIFLDKRLTWVYMHKSSYGLLIVEMICLVLKRKNTTHRKLILTIYFFALILINSMVSLAAAVLVLFAFYIEYRKFSKKTWIRIFVIGIMGSFFAVFGYYYIILNRNLSSLGDRIYIWSLYKSVLDKYPRGMGGKFFTDTFWMPMERSTGRPINNFHNVFLNEMLHYSIPVGVFYTILICYIPIRSIKRSKNKLSKCILLFALFMPMLFDQAMNDLILPMYLIVLFLCFSDQNRNKS